MFRFTIRELLLLTVIVGLAAGWWIDRSRLARSLTRMEGIAITLRDHLELIEGDVTTLALPDGTTWPEGPKVD